MKKLIKEILNESAGVSFEVREWSDIVYNEIISSSNRDRIIIDGYDHYGTYEKFGIDYVVIDFYDEMTGYDPKKSGYDKDGYYVVLLYIQPQIVDGQTRYDLKSALNHELKHAYQDFMRQSKGHSNIDNTKESKEFYTDDFIGLLNSKNLDGPIKTILKYYYYLSNMERDAYLENVYDENPEYEKIVRKVRATDFDEFKYRTNSTTLNDNWERINQLDIPLLKKFKRPNDFIDYSNNRIHNEAEKIIKKINKLKYIHGLNESEFDWTDDAKDWREEYIKLTEEIVKELNKITKRVWNDRMFVRMFDDRISRIIQNPLKGVDYPMHYHTRIVEPLVDMVNDISSLAYQRGNYLDQPKSVKKNMFGKLKPIEETIYLEFRTHRRLIFNYIDESIHNIAGIPEPRLNKLKKLLRYLK
jgi:hypothetical protein